MRSAQGLEPRPARADGDDARAGLDGLADPKLDDRGAVRKVGVAGDHHDARGRDVGDGGGVRLEHVPAGAALRAAH